MGGMALGAAAIGAIAASAARQNRYNYGYVQPPAYYNDEDQAPQVNTRPSRSKKGVAATKPNGMHWRAMCRRAFPAKPKELYPH